MAAMPSTYTVVKKVIKFCVFGMAHAFSKSQHRKGVKNQINTMFHNYVLFVPSIKAIKSYLTKETLIVDKK